MRGTGELAGPPRLYDVGTYKVSLLAGNALNTDTASPRGRLQLAPLGKDHCSVLSLQPSPPLAPGLRETQVAETCPGLRGPAHGSSGVTQRVAGDSARTLQEEGPLPIPGDRPGSQAVLGGGRKPFLAPGVRLMP